MFDYIGVSKDDKDYLRLKNLHEKCFKDLTGKKFGKLTALEVDHKEGKVYFWKCKCDCGNEVVIRGASLSNGHTKSCGCAHKLALLKDLTGMRFGNLTVNSYCEKRGKVHYWNCTCDCGNTRVASGNSLRAGGTVSCGCLRRKIKPDARKHDLTDKKFGMLTAISIENHSMWKCKCDCGNYCSVKTSDLLRGFTTSCGCKSVNRCGSKCENEIKSLVKSLLPNVEISKSRILDMGTYRKNEIDIYIPSLKLGIEYNGSAFHTSKNSRFTRNKPKNYHQNKFLAAKKQGIRLITVFDKDWLENKENITNIIVNIINGTECHNVPLEPIMYTNNDYDDGEWLKQYGYVYCGQEPIPYFTYTSNNYVVYRSGVSKWAIPR